MGTLLHLTLWDVLRLTCGFFFLPHIVGKITAREASLAFFQAARLRPAGAWRWAALLIESALAILLLFDLYAHAAAWAACVYLLIAAAAAFKVSRKWLWHIGGGEFPLFWAICCALVAQQVH